MKKEIALKTILVISIAGILFSGFLSYSEMLKQCILGTCNSKVFTIPSCVYGFVMYVVIFIISVLGLKKR